MNQNELVLADLRAGRVVTPAGAMADHGIMRLAARVLELRKDGHNIVTEQRKTGSKVYAAYRMEA